MESDDEETTLLDNQNQIKSRFGGISSIELIPCSYCNRKFRRERIAVHQEICKNNAQREKERKENELALRRKNWSPQRKPLQSQPTIDEGDQFFSSSLRREYEPSPQRVQRSLSSSMKSNMEPQYQRVTSKNQITYPPINETEQITSINLDQVNFNNNDDIDNKLNIIRQKNKARAPSVGTRDLQEKGKSIFADDLQDLSGSRRIRRKKKSGQSDSTTRSLRSLDESSYDESFDPLDNTQDEVSPSRTNENNQIQTQQYFNQQLDELMNVEEEDEEEGVFPSINFNTNTETLRSTISQRLALLQERRVASLSDSQKLGESLRSHSQQQISDLQHNNSNSHFQQPSQLQQQQSSQTQQEQDENNDENQIQPPSSSQKQQQQQQSNSEQHLLLQNQSLLQRQIKTNSPQINRSKTPQVLSSNSSRVETTVNQLINETKKALISPTKKFAQRPMSAKFPPLVIDKKNQIKLQINDVPQIPQTKSLQDQKQTPITQISSTQPSSQQQQQTQQAIISVQSSSHIPSQTTQQTVKNSISYQQFSQKENQQQIVNMSNLQTNPPMMQRTNVLEQSPRKIRILTMQQIINNLNQEENVHQDEQIKEKNVLDQKNKDKLIKGDNEMVQNIDQRSSIDSNSQTQKQPQIPKLQLKQIPSIQTKLDAKGKNNNKDKEIKIDKESNNNLICDSNPSSTRSKNQSGVKINNNSNNNNNTSKNQNSKDITPIKQLSNQNAKGSEMVRIKLQPSPTQQQTSASQTSLSSQFSQSTSNLNTKKNGLHQNNLKYQTQSTSSVQPLSPQQSYQLNQSSSGISTPGSQSARGSNEIVKQGDQQSIQDLVPSPQIIRQQTPSNSSASSSSYKQVSPNNSKNNGSNIITSTSSATNMKNSTQNGIKKKIEVNGNIQVINSLSQPSNYPNQYSQQGQLTSAQKNTVAQKKLTITIQPKGQTLPTTQTKEKQNEKLTVYKSQKKVSTPTAQIVQNNQPPFSNINSLDIFTQQVISPKAQQLKLALHQQQNQDYSSINQNRNITSPSLSIKTQPNTNISSSTSINSLDTNGQLKNKPKSKPKANQQNVSPANNILNVKQQIKVHVAQKPKEEPEKLVNTQPIQSLQSTSSIKQNVSNNRQFTSESPILPKKITSPTIQTQTVFSSQQLLTIPSPIPETSQSHTSPVNIHTSTSYSHLSQSAPKPQYSLIIPEAKQNLTINSQPQNQISTNSTLAFPLTQTEQQSLTSKSIKTEILASQQVKENPKSKSDDSFALDSPKQSGQIILPIKSLQNSDQLGICMSCKEQLCCTRAKFCCQCGCKLPINQ